MNAADPLARRFGGVARLYGAESLARFGRARIGVVGLGGVGSWAAEALARSGVGHLRLIDLDHISESNTNRQIHALGDEYGKAKVSAMRERIAAIHPGAQVQAIEEFLNAQNASALLQELDLVIDCIDELAAKAALIAQARSMGLCVITCGAAGGRKDPGRIRCDDLALTQGDSLLAKLRHCLRREYGFCGPGSGRHPPPFGVPAVFSSEPADLARNCEPDALAPGSPLACGGYGSVVTVTATMGFAAAACALDQIQNH